MTNQPSKNETNIFDNIMPRIFKNYNVLTPAYIPSKLIGRDTQIDNVIQAFTPILSHGSPKHLILQGKSGTGKTVVVRYVVSQLVEMSKKRPEMNLNVVKVEVNCEKKKTVVRILYEIIRELVKNTNQEISVPQTGMATGWYFDKIYEIMNSDNISLILVLDEIDKIDSDNLLYNLSRAMGEDINDNLFIGIIMITNDTKFFEDGRIDSRVVSTLDPISLVFLPYDADMLREILEQRVSEAFIPGVLNEMVVPLCAALGAKEHGDARRALSLLASAGRIAERNKDNEILEKHVHYANEDYDRNSMLEVIKGQPFQSQLTLLSTIYQCQLSKLDHKNIQITTRDIYNQYCLFAKNIGEMELSQQRVSNLITELETLSIVKTIEINAGRHGRTRTISISFNEKDVVQCLLDNPKSSSSIVNFIETIWGNPVNDIPSYNKRLYAIPAAESDINLRKYF